jgi:hypothetical protein
MFQQFVDKLPTMLAYTTLKRIEQIRNDEFAASETRRTEEP